MSDRFKQKQIHFRNQARAKALKVSKLLELVNDHPYVEKIRKVFRTKSIGSDVINVENIDVLYNAIAAIKRDYTYFNITAYNKNVHFTRGKSRVDGINDDSPILFNFSEYVDSEGEVHNNISAYALYDSKSAFFDGFSMSKYANMLFDNSLDQLAEINLEYFRKLSKSTFHFNKHHSYRLVSHNGEQFVRGVTSTRYKEYGVDFTFVVAMLMLHKHMQRSKGNNYRISFAALSESKFDMVVTTDNSKDAGDFGKVRSAISVKTNDLGNGALTLTNIVRLDVKGEGIYLYPTSKEVAKKDITINHGNTSVDTALKQLSEADDFYGYVDYFINELKSIKAIKNPDELRQRVLLKINHPKSALKGVKELKDVFKTVINNEIKDFAKFLEMCKKAEELDIDYDLKDKLRVIISDIILNKK